MTDQQPRQGNEYKVDVKDNSGQVAVGEDIRQNQTTFTVGQHLSPEELQQMRDAFASLRGQVEREAPPEVREEAVRQAEALEQAATAAEPDVSAMSKVRGWFLRHAPGLLGAVTGVIVNPILGKVVEAAGDHIAAEFRRQFPEAAPESSESA
jgi:hypothetical protein